MPREEIKDLRKFLKPFPEETKEIVFWLREFVWDLYPKTNELIYDNYNAVAFGWSPTDKAGDVFCSVAVYFDYINFGFNRGSDFDDPFRILTGDGSLYRYLRVKEKEDFPEKEIKELLS